MPAGARYVGRGTRWGNGWKIGDPHPDTGAPMTRADVVAEYRKGIEAASEETREWIRRELGGRDLACWCPEGKACHGDVLLEFANPREGGR